MVELQRCEWYYIYRWGISQLHMSGRYDDSAYSEIGARPVEPGRFVLHPHWRMDYGAETRRLVIQEQRPSAVVTEALAEGISGAL
jgi:hypothetical protein